MILSEATIELIVRAVKLGSCWCTERVWYAPKVEPIKCTMCLAREAIERENPTSQASGGEKHG